MEEILASIRRIIADDNPDAAAKAAAAGATSAPPHAAVTAPAAAPQPMSQDDIDAMLADQAAEEGDVLDLGAPVSPPRAEAPENFRQVPASDVVFREEPLREPAPAQVSYAAPEVPADRLLSAQTNAAVSAAFGSLASTMLSENSRTIEDLVREMLRPMLKAWLDDNLPGLVERMVRAEIERVSRGGR
jgi:cell pole-organizing protein PopZ